MKKSMESFSKILLAVLPLLADIQDLREAFVLGSLTVAVFGGTVCFFGLFQNGFPRKLRSLAVVLWLTTTAQLAFDLLGILPFFVGSVFLLLPDQWFKSDSKARGRRVKDLWTPRPFWANQIKYGVGFLMMALYVGLFVEFLKVRFFVGSLAGPAGAFLLLALAALCWQNQPGWESEQPFGREK